MKQRVNLMRYFWRTHLISLLFWIPIASLSKLIEFVFSDTPFNVADFVSKSLFTGFVIASILALIHLIRIWKLGIRIKTIEDLRTSQSCELNTTLKEEEIEHTLKGFDKRFKKITDNLYVLRKSSLFGWTKTELQILRKENKHFNVQIRSKPTIATTFLDFSENLILVRSLERLLTR